MDGWITISYVQGRGRIMSQPRRPLDDLYFPETVEQDVELLAAKISGRSRRQDVELLVAESSVNRLGSLVRAGDRM